MLGVDNFHASDGWLARTRRRQDIIRVRVAGEAAEADLQGKFDFLGQFSQLRRGYEDWEIFNADETGAFFRATPDSSYAIKGHKLSGGKKSKERLTILFCVSMTGEKRKLLVIGKSLKPRCFKNVDSLPVDYYANKSAWMTAEIWEEWLKNFDRDLRREQKKALLFVDQCTAHKSIPHLTHLKVEFLPANTTSVLQPIRPTIAVLSVKES